MLLWFFSCPTELSSTFCKKKKKKKKEKERKLIIAVGFVVIVTFVDDEFFVSNFNGSAFSV